MLTELLKKLNGTDSSTIETDSLTIQNNAIITENNSIQIHNISMLFKSEFVSPITLQDIIILGVSFFGIFIPMINFIAIPLLLIYGYYFIQKYQKHLETKYFIVFNLGSSQNHSLYFPEKDFRDQVFQVVTESFQTGKQNFVYIDFKNKNIEQNITEQTVLKQGATQNKFSGNNNQNIVGTDFGSENIVSLNGDALSNSKIIKETTLENTSFSDINNTDIPWEELRVEIQELINSKKISDDNITIFNNLLQASENKNKQEFAKIIKDSRTVFNSEFIQNTLSGVLSTLITTIIIK